MHTEPMPESAGTFRQPQPSSSRCPKCKQTGAVSYRIWDSHCGGYEDAKYDCTCGHNWWVEGPDS